MWHTIIIIITLVLMSFERVPEDTPKKIDGEINTQEGVVEQPPTQENLQEWGSQAEGVLVAVAANEKEAEKPSGELVEELTNLANIRIREHTNKIAEYEAMLENPDLAPEGAKKQWQGEDLKRVIQGWIGDEGKFIEGIQSKQKGFAENPRWQSILLNLLQNDGMNSLDKIPYNVVDAVDVFLESIKKSWRKKKVIRILMEMHMVFNRT